MKRTIAGLLLLFAVAAMAGEPEPMTILEEYGPVIDRVEARSFGLFRHRSDFGALRFVQTAPGRYEARRATSVRGVMLEQAAALDSTKLARVRQGLVLLRDHGVSNVELLLETSAPFDASCLGPATHARAYAGAASLGTLGLGVGLVTSAVVARDPKVGTTAAISVAATLLGGWCGGYAGSRTDAGRPARYQPRCAIAGYDVCGYPFYEEDVKALLRGNNVLPWTAGGIAFGVIVAGVTSSIVARNISDATGRSDHNGMAELGGQVLNLGIILSVSYIANTIGQDMDRESALAELRRRHPAPSAP